MHIFCLVPGRDCDNLDFLVVPHADVNGRIRAPVQFVSLVYLFAEWDDNFFKLRLQQHRLNIVQKVDILVRENVAFVLETVKYLKRCGIVAINNTLAQTRQEITRR